MSKRAQILLIFTWNMCYGRIYQSTNKVWCVTDFALMNYDVIIVEKVPFPVLAYLKWRTFSSTCFTSPIIMMFYQQVRSIKKSKLAKFQDDIISIDGVMTSQTIRHDVKIWWRQILPLRNCDVLWDKVIAKVECLYKNSSLNLSRSVNLAKPFAF